jgi:hypothetical protein
MDGDELTPTTSLGARMPGLQEQVGDVELSWVKFGCHGGPTIQRLPGALVDFLV